MIFVIKSEAKNTTSYKVFKWIDYINFGFPHFNTLKSREQNKNYTLRTNLLPAAQLSKHCLVIVSTCTGPSKMNRAEAGTLRNAILLSLLPLPATPGISLWNAEPARGDSRHLAPWEGAARGFQPIHSIAMQCLYCQPHARHTGYKNGPLSLRNSYLSGKIHANN